MRYEEALKIWAAERLGVSVSDINYIYEDEWWEGYCETCEYKCTGFSVGVEGENGSKKIEANFGRVVQELFEIGQR